MTGKSLIVGDQVVKIKDGDLVEKGSWVYVWIRFGETTEVVYVGATGLPPQVRAWLHLHEEDPRVGRVRAERPDALQGELVVHAFRLDASLDRRRVKNALVTILDGNQLPDHALSDVTWKAALDVVQRIGLSKI